MRKLVSITVLSLAPLLLSATLAACGGDKPEAKAPTAGTEPSADTSGGGAGPAPALPADPIAGGGGGGGATTVVDVNQSGLTGAAKEAYQRGFRAWLDGDLPSAKKGFAEAASADPKSPVPRYAIGLVDQRTGDLSGAQQEWRTAFTMAPDFEVAMGAYALSLASAGHLTEAETFINEKKGKAPNSPRLLTYAAEVKSLQGDHGGAQAMAQDALRLNPDFKEAMVCIARDHWRARKMDLAEYALKAILEGFDASNPARDPDNADAHLVRGLIRRDAGKRAFAIKDFEAANAKRPDLVEALINLGAMRLEAGNAQDAQPLLEKAVRYAPNSANAHLNLGDCYRLLGRVADSKKELDTALAMDAALAQAHYNLGLLYLFSPSVPGANANEQVATAIKELETYKTMRGPKAIAVNDDIDDLLNRAKAKQAELRGAAALPPPPPPPPASGGATAPPAAAAGDAGAPF